MLKTIEKKTGKPITELFDWVVGTSTGGVLALGMIYGETTRCVNPYQSVSHSPSLKPSLSGWFNEVDH